MTDIAVIEEGMRRCFWLAMRAVETGNYPLGAVVLDQSGILAEAGSTLVQSVDPSGHPEVVAMRRAAEKIGSRYLPGAMLISTMEPCPMCSSMAIWAKMKGIAYATPQDKAAAFGRELEHPLLTFRQIRLRCRDVLDRGDPRLELYEGVLEDEAFGLLRRLRDKLAGR